MAPVAVFRFDAGPAIGSGHAVRCLALAEALAGLGWRCVLAVGPGTRASAPGFAAGRHAVLDLDGSEAAEARRIGQLGADLLVADCGPRNAAVAAACRPAVGRILALEDAPRRRHDCDLLLDPTPGRRAADYAALVPPRAALFLGPAYALLRPAFAAARAEALARRAAGPVRRVLVNFGGTDAGGATLPALRAAAKALPDAAIDVAVGGAAPTLAALRQAAEGVGRRCRLHVDSAEMAALMTAADLAIGAPGGASWERCALGLPSLLLTVADNQRDIAGALAAAGAAESLGPAEANPESGLAARIAALAADAPRRARMAAAAAALCDGRGARRVPLALIGTRPARDGQTVALRLAAEADADRLLAWQREPGARRFARNPATPAADEHRAWLARRLGDPDCWLMLIEHGGVPAGTLRLDRLSGEEGAAFELSILVGAAHRGRGVGRAALALARALAAGADLLAEVLPGNAASRALFRGAGYREAAPGRFLAVPGARG